jgi:type II secretory pathway pseudopilin PulG
VKNQTTPIIARSAAGFTLLEVTGVLALLTVLCWVTVESVLLRMKQARRQAEASELATLAEGLKQAMLRTRSIPAPDNWAALAASELALPLQRVLRNEVGQSRVLLFDPEFRAGDPPGPPPVTQGPAGSGPPVNPRCVLVSSLAEVLPPLSGPDFNNLWSRARDQFPATWPAGWSGETADLLIERIDLRSQLHRVILNNLGPEPVARYSIDHTNQSAVIPLGGRADAWFFGGSFLELWSENGTVQTIDIVTEDTSYVFENGRWNRHVMTGPTPAIGLGALVEQFLMAPSPPPNPHQFGADPPAIVDELFLYLRAYANWAEHGFRHGVGAPEQEPPFRRALVESQARLHDFTSNLTNE